MSLSGGCKLMKGLTLTWSLNYCFTFADFFNKNKDAVDDPGITISLIYISKKWWEV
jgi:hypothetical protein